MLSKMNKKGEKKSSAKLMVAHGMVGVKIFSFEFYRYEMDFTSITLAYLT